jgi:hypothetical protein
MTEKEKITKQKIDWQAFRLEQMKIARAQAQIKKESK